MWQTVFFGLFGGVVALGIVTYFQSRSEENRQHQHHRRQSSPERGAHWSQCASSYRPSRSTDKCTLCHETMIRDMQLMKCGHGLHKECFNGIIKLRPDCIICNKPIRVTEIGDICVFCQNEMTTRENMKYLGCGHAFDAECIDEHVNISLNKKCPTCRFPM